MPLVLTLLPLTIALSPVQTDADVLGFADAFDRAQLAQDRRALEDMVSDALVFIDGTGTRQGKAEFIAGWTVAGDRFDPIVLVDRRVVRLGPDAAVVSAETRLSGQSGGKSFSSRFRFADTFVRTGGKWQAAHIQVTPIR